MLCAPCGLILYHILFACIPTPVCMYSNTCLHVFQHLFACIPIPVCMCFNTCLHVFQYLFACVPIPVCLCSNPCLMMSSFSIDLDMVELVIKTEVAEVKAVMEGDGDAEEKLKEVYLRFQQLVR